MKKLFILSALLPTIAFANPDFDSWKWDAGIGGFMAPDQFGANIGAIIYKKKNELLFSLAFNDDQCLFTEPEEPYGIMQTYGNSVDYKYKCVGKGRAMVFPAKKTDLEGILGVFERGDNICIKTNREKHCYLGSGAKEVIAYLNQ